MHEEFMKRAIELSKKASLDEKTGGVFGAVIVKDGKIIAEGYNQVVSTKDPTWHAEMHAIRQASKALNSFHLDGCDMYTSAECCPMCLAAAYWARLRNIYFGATMEDAKKYGNFEDIHFLEEVKKENENRVIKCIPLMRDEAVVIWKAFSQMPERAWY